MRFDANAAIDLKQIVSILSLGGHVLQYDVVVWGATGTRNCLCTETAPVLPASRVLYIRAGFVGKLVCEYLVRDYRVRWPDVPRSRSALILAMLSDLMVKDTHAGQDSMGNGCSQPAEAGYCPA